MAWYNIFHKHIPRGSHPQGAAKTQYKKYQVLNYLKAAWSTLRKSVSVVNAERKLAGSALGRRLPQIPLSARFGVEAKLANIMSGQSFGAASKKGVSHTELTERETALLEKMNEEGDRGIVFIPRAADAEKSDVKGFVLKKVKKKALKQRRAEMVAARNKCNVVIERVTKAEMRGVPKAVLSDLQEQLQALKQEQGRTRDDYVLLRAAAMKLKVEEMKEKYRDIKSASRLAEAEAVLDSMRSMSLAPAAEAVVMNTGSKWADQVILLQDLDNVAAEFRENVYDDVHDYLESNKHYKRMVVAQSKHQIAMGTNQLGFILPGKRLPGLPYFMEMARLELNEPPLDNNQLLVRGSQLMQESWKTFREPIKAEMAKIIIAEDTEHGKRGQFDKSRMWDYFNMKAALATLEQMKRVEIDPNSHAGFITDYGEEIGFHEKYPGENPAKVAANHRAKVAMENGVNVAGGNGIFTHVKYVAPATVEQEVEDSEPVEMVSPEPLSLKTGGDPLELNLSSTVSEASPSLRMGQTGTLMDQAIPQGAEEAVTDPSKTKVEDLLTEFDPLTQSKDSQ